MFEKKSPHSNESEQIVPESLLIDIEDIQEAGISEGKAIEQAHVIMRDNYQGEGIIVSPDADNTVQSYDLAPINLEYYKPSKPPYIEEEFVTFGRHQFGLEGHESICNFLKDETNFEEAIGRIDQVYSSLENHMLKIKRKTNDFKQGLFTEMLLKYDLTLSEIGTLLVTMKIYNQYQMMRR